MSAAPHQESSASCPWLCRCQREHNLGTNQPTGPFMLMRWRWWQRQCYKLKTSNFFWLSSLQRSLFMSLWRLSPFHRKQHGLLGILKCQLRDGQTSQAHPAFQWTHPTKNQRSNKKHMIWFVCSDGWTPTRILGRGIIQNLKNADYCRLEWLESSLDMSGQSNVPNSWLWGLDNHPQLSSFPSPPRERCQDGCQAFPTYFAYFHPVPVHCLGIVRPWIWLNCLLHPFASWVQPVPLQENLWHHSMCSILWNFHCNSKEHPVATCNFISWL